MRTTRQNDTTIDTMVMGRCSFQWLGSSTTSRVARTDRISSSTSCCESAAGGYPFAIDPVTVITELAGSELSLEYPRASDTKATLRTQNGPWMHIINIHPIIKCQFRLTDRCCYYYSSDPKEMELKQCCKNTNDQSKPMIVLPVALP